MKSSEKEPAIFIKHHGGLMPNSDGALDLLRTIPLDKEVFVEIRHYRNVKALKAYWAMLRDCIDSTGCTTNVEALHKAVKIGLGYVDHVTATDKNGVVTVSVYPASIALNEMPDAEFKRYFDEVKRYLAENHGFGG